MAFGYGIQRLAINPVMGRPVLLTLTLTFGLNLLLDNAMLSFFRADYRKIVLDPPLGVLTLGPDVGLCLLRMELVEHLAKILHHARALGGAQPLPPEEMARLLEQNKKAFPRGRRI